MDCYMKYIFWKQFQISISGGRFLKCLLLLFCHCCHERTKNTKSQPINVPSHIESYQDLFYILCIS